MPSNKVIRVGSEVEMHFRLSLDNGFVVEDTQQDGPFIFTLGDGSILPGLEDAIEGLAEEAVETVRLQPEQAYGYSNSEYVMEMSRDEFPSEIDIKEGVIVGFSSPSGEEVPGTIIEMNKDVVIVDFNHPLSGQIVIFDLEILSVKNTPLN